MKETGKLDVTVIGAGMIVNDQILPSLYHLQRLGVISRNLKICARTNRHVRQLHESPFFKESFPGHGFTPFPGLERGPDESFPDLFREVIRAMEPQNAVVIALPDHLHYMAVKEALANDQHVLCVKPLVLTYAEAKDIEQEAFKKGLYVGVEYHKRFDRRALIARRRYRAGEFGEFIIGEAKLIEPYYYRNSNFQNWFKKENTDPFVYIGCHYVDLVHFITGLLPTEVSVRGITRQFPNGNEGFLWSSGRVGFENGALLTLTNGLGYPDAAAGSNEQCLSMYFEGEGKTGHLRHNDQFRGVEHSFLEGIGPGGSAFNYVNPDYFQFVPWEGDGLKPVGYGYDSIEAHLNAIGSVAARRDDLDARRTLLRAINDKGLLPTPGNSWYNELVIEAARKSILNDGKPVRIVQGDAPRLEFI